jgi:hypothetical protein
MPGIILTFPIVAGKVEAWRRFCQEMAGSRYVMYEASRRVLGITYERMALVETAFGSATITTLEADDIGLTLNQILTSDAPFDRWYREQIQDLHSVGLESYPEFLATESPYHHQEMYFEWTLSYHSRE